MSIKLNSRQTEAAEHKDGPMLVLAGPGSGKTTVIIQRVKNLIENHNVDPREILVISYTKASAEEMKKRFEKLTNEQYKVTFSTFHAFFFRVVRRSANMELDVGSVIDENEKKKIISKIVDSEGIAAESLDNIINDISLVKSELIRPEDFISSEISNDDFVKIYNMYDSCKKQKNVIDFDDMQEMCYNIFKGNDNILKLWQSIYKYILIDEFQDINRIQYEIVKLVAMAHNNIFAVGDDDQSIYGFRGSRPEFMLVFPKDFENTREVTLNINYRSTEEIIKLSNAVICDNKKRYEKDIVGTGKNGKMPKVLSFNDIESEALGVADKILLLFKAKVKPHKIAVIYRTNSQSRAFVDAFMKKSIPYQLKDGGTNIYEHWIMKDILSYVKLAYDLNENECFKNILNKPSRYLNKSVVEGLDRNGKEGPLIKKALKCSKFAGYQKERIEDLIYELNMLRGKSPSKAIHFIRKEIKYDHYISNYAEYAKTSVMGLLAVADEIEAAAEAYDNFDDFLFHAQKYTEEIKKNTRKSTENGKVVLTTMHSAKGLEFDAVFIISAVDGIIPYNLAKTQDEIEEERRLFYVALTRAKFLLYVSFIYSRYSEETTPTVFLKKYIPKNRRKK